MSFVDAQIEIQGESLVIKNDGGYCVVMEPDPDKFESFENVFGDDVFEMEYRG